MPSVVPAQGMTPQPVPRSHSLGAAHAAKVSQQQCILAKTVALRDENGCAVGKVFLLQRRRLLFESVSAARPSRGGRSNQKFRPLADAEAEIA